MPGLQKRDLIRLLIHETWRIYGDRLVYPEEKQWTDERLDAVCRESSADPRAPETKKRRMRIGGNKISTYVQWVRCLQAIRKHLRVDAIDTV